MRRRQGFTLIELMIVIAIIAALAAVLLPALSGIVERMRFVSCSANLNGLGKQMGMYDKDQEGKFPAIRKHESATDCPDDPARVTATDSGNPAPWITTKTMARYTTDSTTDLSPLQGSTGFGMQWWVPMQEVWPLIVAGAGPDMFHCPADVGWRARPEKDRAGTNLKAYGWTNGNQYSYGIQWPFAGLTDGATVTPANLAVPYGKKVPARLVVFADQNPGGPVGVAGRQHSNHPELGCNALEKGGTVIEYFEKRMKGYNSKAGVNGNDIYVDDTATDGVPKSAYDTVIVPYQRWAMN